MKELSIEEKAKRYDEALKVLHKYDGANIMFSQSLKEEMFPELKESKDEKIRKVIYGWIYTQPSQFFDSGFSKEEMLAWLEKQGEHANFRNKIQVGDKVTRNQDGILVNLSQLKRVAKKDEKQGEQKSIDDLSPQEAMDIAVAKCFEQGEQNPAFEMKTPEESLGIDSETYNKIVDECIYGEQKPVDKDEQKGTNIVEEDMTPFQKKVFCIIDTAIEEEQGLKQVCDELLRLAHDEIMQTSTWSEEDKDILFRTINDLKFLRDTISIDPKYAINIIDKEREINWLKSLKDRIQPQPKQEWSEEDERFQNVAINILNSSKVYTTSPDKYENTINWLKSLKERYTWKPSDEQMTQLKKYCPDNRPLTSLYEQLKKLKG